MKPRREVLSLGRAVMNGVGWLLAQNVGGRIIGFLSQIVLARLLAPEDFGKLALAGTITSIAGVLVNFGVDDVLLQRQKTMRFWVAAALFTSLGLGIVSMLIVLAAAPFAAMAYKAPELVVMLSIMAVSMPIGALSTVPSVALRASLNYRLLTTIATVELVATQAFTIVLAMQGMGAYSFVIPMPVVAAGRAVTLWYLVKPEVGRLRMRQVWQMGAKGAAVFGSKLLIAAVGQGPYFVLGLLAPKSVVGAYYFAFRLAIQPIQMMAGSLSSVLFPALSTWRNDPNRQRAAAIEVARVLAFFVMPFCFLQAAVSDPFVRLVFGAKWEAAIPFMQVLSIGLGFDAVSWIAGALLSARGEFKRAFLYSAAFAPIFFVVVAVGALSWSAAGVAISVSLYYVVFAPVFSYAVFKGHGTSLRDVTNIYLLPTAFAGIAMSLAYGVSLTIPWGNLARIAVTAAFGGGLYLALVRVFAPRTFMDLTKRLVGIARRPSA